MSAEVDVEGDFICAARPYGPCESTVVGGRPVALRGRCSATVMVAPEFDREGRVAVWSKREVEDVIAQPVDLPDFAWRLCALSKPIGSGANSHECVDFIATFTGVAPGHQAAVGVAGDVDLRGVDGVAGRCIGEHAVCEVHVVAVALPEVPCFVQPRRSDQQDPASACRP